jgi:hypothetical protein
MDLGRICVSWWKSVKKAAESKKQEKWCPETETGSEGIVGRR